MLTCAIRATDISTVAHSQSKADRLNLFLLRFSFPLELRFGSIIFTDSVVRQAENAKEQVIKP